MRGYHRLKVGLLTLVLTGSMLVSVKIVDLPSAFGENDTIRIFGLVENPLNLLYTELLSLPMVSETVYLECVFHFPNVTLEWTGVPLFHLLTLAQVRPEGREVVFRARDGFSSSITMEEALQPTIILALMANDTLLSEVAQISQIQGGIRIVVPCKWGYKWVTDIEEIEVVDYDYRGTYESSGFSDEADIPGCLHPQIQPPLETFTSPFGNRTFEVNAFTNISIMTLNFDYLKKEINLNVTVPPETTGFATLILENAFLRGPYSTSLDGVDSKVIHANTTGLSFLYLEIPEGSHTVGIIGTEFFGSVPEIRLSVDKTAFVGETVTFDASRSSDDGRIVSYKWDLGDGTKNAGKSVNHTYMKEGTYQVLVNLTDNDGLSSVKTFEMTIQNRPMELSIVIKVLLASISGLIILMMIILVLRRKKK